MDSRIIHLRDSETSPRRRVSGVKPSGTPNRLTGSAEWQILNRKIECAIGGYDANVADIHLKGGILRERPSSGSGGDKVPVLRVEEA